MRRFIALLLATTMLCTASVALASSDEDYSQSADSITAMSRGRGNGYGRTDGNTSGGKNVNRNIPNGSAGFFLQLDGLQMDSNGNISGRPSEYFTDIVATSKLAKNRYNGYAIAIGGRITEKDILAEVTNPPKDDDAFDSARSQLMYKGYIRSDKGEVIPWSKLNSGNYRVEWYVFKHEDDGWHIDGRILDLSTNSTIDIVIPDDPKDIPGEAYEEDNKKGDKDNEGEITEEREEVKDTSINLNGALFAYIFGYEPIINATTDEDGNEKFVAEVYMGMDDSVTTEQVSAMLVRVLDQEGYTNGKKFKVTPSMESYRNEWYARGLAYECSVGGLPSDDYLPLGDVSRGLVAKLVSRALNLNLTEDAPFTDIAGNEYEEDIKKVYAYGYMSGVSRDEFAPDKIMTRAEFCKLFNNILGRSNMGLTALDKDGNEYEITAEDYSFVDMSPRHWAYEECLRATSAYDENGYVSISKRQENIRNKLDDYGSQLLY